MYMKNLLFALIILLASCTTEKVNIIKGEIEGIKIGDKIYLTVGGPHYGNRYVSDSSIVKKDGEFILETKVSDANVYIHCTNSTESLNFDRINNNLSSG